MIHRDATWADLDALLVTRGVKVGAPTLGQTTGGTHVRGSYHYTGDGRDYGKTSDRAAVLAALLPLAQGPGHVLAELFYADTYYKDGARITPTASLRDGHQGHVHAGLRRSATVADLAAGSGPILVIPGDQPFDGVGVDVDVSDVTGAVGGALRGIDGIAEAAQRVASATGVLAQRSTWVRVAQVAAGMVVGVAGYLLLTSDLAPADLIGAAT